MKQTGESRDKLNLNLADDTNFLISITVWGEICQFINNQIKIGDVIAFKGCKLSDYNGKTINASS